MVIVSVSWEGGLVIRPCAGGSGLKSILVDCNAAAGCGFSSRRFPSKGQQGLQLSSRAGARGLLGDCGAQRMWRRPVASPPAAT